MNHFLLIVNILLAIGAVISFGSNIETMRKSGTEITVPKRQPKKSVATVKQTETVKPPTIDENISAIINGDIFNPERTPNTGGPNSGRSEMTLAGTFKVGKVAGAIVIQRNRQRQFNPSYLPFWGEKSPIHLAFFEPFSSRVGIYLTHEFSAQKTVSGCAFLCRLQREVLQS